MPTDEARPVKPRRVATTSRVPPRDRGDPGFALLELLVALAAFAIVGAALGTLYLSSTQALEEGDVAAAVQRQGTQIQEEIARHIQRASALQMDPPGASDSLCHPSGASLSPGKSIIYQRTVGTSSNPVSPATEEYWCIYEYKRSGDPYAQLWRCRVAGLTPPQVCTTAPENLIANALTGSSGLLVEVSGSCFTPAGTDCPPPNPTCSGCPPSVDVTFALDVKRSSTNPGSMLGRPRTFGFNVTIRN